MIYMNVTIKGTIHSVHETITEEWKLKMHPCSEISRILHPCCTMPHVGPKSAHAQKVYSNPERAYLGSQSTQIRPLN